MQGAFYGIGAAVIAIIARSAYKLVWMTVARDASLGALRRECSGHGLDGVGSHLGLPLVRKSRRSRQDEGQLPRPARRLSCAALVGDRLHGVAAPGLWLRVFIYFAEAGAFVFGAGSHRAVPVRQRGRRLPLADERQFLDAVAVAMITPGPSSSRSPSSAIWSRAHRPRWPRSASSCRATSSSSFLLPTSARGERPR